MKAEAALVLTARSDRLISPHFFGTREAQNIFQRERCLASGLLLWMPSLTEARRT